MAIALLSGVISALAMHHYYPEQTFTQAQWEQMEWGQSFQALWPKLTQPEQEKLKAISQGEKPHLKRGQLRNVRSKQQHLQMSMLTTRVKTKVGLKIKRSKAGWDNACLATILATTGF